MKLHSTLGVLAIVLRIARPWVIRSAGGVAPRDIASARATERGRKR